MKNKLMLFVTAFIWGTAFVGQRVGMDHLGPFTFTGVRFFVGALSLLPVIYFFSLLRKRQRVEFSGSRKDFWIGSIACGLAMFGGMSFQQAGIAHTTAGKAGFITTLYIILVPVLGLFLRHRVGRNVWFGVMLAVLGMYLLSMTNEFTMAKGDLLVLGGTIFWAIHILIIDHYAPKVDGIKLAFVQFFIASILSLIVAVTFETVTWAGIEAAAFPILYTGVIVVGVAFTLQIFGQSGVNPTVAAIILSLEAVFAVLAGMVLLGETMTAREITGTVILFLAVILAQLPSKQKELQSS